MRDIRVKIGVLQLPLFKDILTEEVKVKKRVNSTSKIINILTSNIRSVGSHLAKYRIGIEF